MSKEIETLDKIASYEKKLIELENKPGFSKTAEDKLEIRYLKSQIEKGKQFLKTLSKREEDERKRYLKSLDENEEAARRRVREEKERKVRRRKEQAAADEYERLETEALHKRIERDKAAAAAEYARQYESLETNALHKEIERNRKERKEEEKKIREEEIARETSTEKAIRQIEEKAEKEKKLFRDRINDLENELERVRDQNSIQALKYKHDLKNSIDLAEKNLQETEKEKEDAVKKLKPNADWERKGFFGKMGSNIGESARVNAPLGGNPFKAAKNSMDSWNQSLKDKREKKENRREELKKETLKDYWARQKDKQEYVKQKWANAREWKEQWKERANKASGALFIILAIIVHMMKFSLNFGVAATWILDVLLAIVVYLFLFRKEDRNANGVRSIAIILALEIVLPILLGYNQALAQNKYIKYYLLNRLLTPWWLYYATIWANDTDKPGLFPRFIKIAIIFFWLGVLLTVPAIGFAKVPMAYYADMQQSELAVDYYLKSYNFWLEEVPDILGRGFSSIGDAFDRQMAIATGGYYVGHVDENQNKPLGVFLESVKPAAPDFYYSSPASVYGTLKIASLDDGIKVDVNCYNGYKKDGEFQDSQKASEVYPKEEFWMYDMERKDVDCIFDERRLDRGVHRITLTADFNFDTMGYLKTFFMNKDTMRSLMQQGKEPLKEFGVKEEPSAVYTNGPVRIGMGGFGQPIGIDSDSSQDSFKLGITVESNTGWKGKIKQLEELKIQVPEGLEIDTATCNFDFEKVTEDTDKCVAGHMKYRTKEFRTCQNDAMLTDDYFNNDGSINTNKIAEDNKEQSIGFLKNCLKLSCNQEQDGYTSYYLKIDTREGKDKVFKNIENYLTISCRMKVTNPATVLGDTPVAIHYLRARARYAYEIEQSTQITIKKSDEEVAADTAYSSRTDEESLRFVSTDYADIIKEVVDTLNNVEIAKSTSPTDNSYAKLPKKSSGDHYLDVCLIAAQMTLESGGNPKAVGGVGEQGLLQIRPDITAPDILKKIMKNDALSSLREKYKLESESDYDGFNPEHNILVGAHYLAERFISADELLDNNADYYSSDITKYALAEYNAGPGATAKRCKKDDKYMQFAECKDSFTEITQSYVEKITDGQKKCKEDSLDESLVLEEPVREKSEFTYTVSYGYTDDDLRSCLMVQDNPPGPSDEIPDRYIILAHNQKYAEIPIPPTISDADIAFLGCIDGKQIKTIKQSSEAFLPATRLSLNSREQVIEDTDSPDFIIDLSFNRYPLQYLNTKLGVKISDMRYSRDELGEEYQNNFVPFDKYPFVKIKLEECSTENHGRRTCKFTVKYFTKLIINSPQLKQNDRLDDGTTSFFTELVSPDMVERWIDDSTPVYRDAEASADAFLQVHYDSNKNIIIRNKVAENKMCTVKDWDKYKKEGVCEDVGKNTQGVGITIKNKNIALGDGIAEVQIKYDPFTYSPSCCAGNFNRCVEEEKKLCLDPTQAGSS